MSTVCNGILGQSSIASDRFHVAIDLPACISPLTRCSWSGIVGRYFGVSIALETFFVHSTVFYSN